MANPIVMGLELGVAIGFVLSVALGIYLWARLRLAGGLELALAHVVANPARRRFFVATVGISFGAFVAAGLVESTSYLVGFDTVADFVVAVLLLAGGLGLLVLTAGALRPGVLSLNEEWALAESAARASARSPPPKGPDQPP